MTSMFTFVEGNFYTADEDCFGYLGNLEEVLTEVLLSELSLEIARRQINIKKTDVLMLVQTPRTVPDIVAEMHMFLFLQNERLITVFLREDQFHHLQSYTKANAK